MAMPVPVPVVLVMVLVVVPVTMVVGTALIRVVTVGVFEGRRFGPLLVRHGCLACGRWRLRGVYVAMYARDNESGAHPLQEQPTTTQVETAVEAFRMLSDGTRLRLMWLLASGEYDVSSLAGAIGVARPSVSQHLAKLRLAGLVDARRHGRRVLYRARDAHVRRLIAEALFHADHEVSGIPRHDT
ncbi:metalloregulator ArsR/SmtB family transcription factor [Sphaerisporangium sp. NPDC049002]|uniref:ArsR/SmtB family transcription factor n=1 Tax=Sphaerisporangium sp. NPDC049002 TaxID=3155392 RepID=UPI003410DF96